MHKKNYKGRVEKSNQPKCKGVFYSYSKIMTAYASRLSANEKVNEYACNVPIKIKQGEYLTDFYIVASDGMIAVRECTTRKSLTQPHTIELLDASREYWLAHGISDWGIVIDAM